MNDDEIEIRLRALEAEAIATRARLAYVRVTLTRATPDEHFGTLCWEGSLDDYLKMAGFRCEACPEGAAHLENVFLRRPPRPRSA